EQWLMSVIRSIGEGVLVVDRAGSICLMNSVAEAITGSALEDSLGAHWQELWRFPDPKACGGTSDPVSLAIEEAKRIDLLDCPVRFQKTGSRIVIGSIAPIREGPSRVTGSVIAFRDVTTDRTLESQYQQIRHLEALQRLAGGVAHNMNSVLTVISGYAESLLRSFDEPDPRFRDLKMIETAGERAGAFTRQLIAFSRNQPAQPALLDLNEQIASLEQVLTHSAGPQVQIELKLEPGLGKVEADPLHLE